MAKKKRAKVVWAAAVYSDGILYKKVPVKCKWFDETERWWDRTENLEVAKLGVDAQYWQVTFASENKDDVKNWIRGVRSVHTVLANKVYEPFKVREDRESS